MPAYVRVRNARKSLRFLKQLHPLRDGTELLTEYRTLRAEIAGYQSATPLLAEGHISHENEGTLLANIKATRTRLQKLNHRWEDFQNFLYALAGVSVTATLSTMGVASRTMERFGAHLGGRIPYAQWSEGERIGLPIAIGLTLVAVTWIVSAILFDMKMFNLWDAFYDAAYDFHKSVGHAKKKDSPTN